MIKSLQEELNIANRVLEGELGVLTKEQTIEALKIKKLYNQLVLTSTKALSYLKFCGTIPEEEF